MSYWPDDGNVEAFSQRWVQSGGMVWEAKGLGALTEAVGEAWQQLVVPDPAAVVWPVIYWVNQELETIDWSQIFETRGPVEAWQWGPGKDLRSVASRAVLGMTGCAWAVAATGSVAIYASEDTGLWPSILPPAHLVLVARPRIVGTVAEGLSQMAGDCLPPLFKIVTGPSMTADIEGTLVIGVHGPGRVGAIVYEV
ncbi:MAG: LUD domain-containing protein [Firmicutes bacterium]|nr:LUD domain-containing protein [Bacillota bacterium]